MRAVRGLAGFWIVIGAWALLGGGAGCGGGTPGSAHEAIGFQTFTSPQSNPIVLSPDRAFVYVANTTSNSVSFVRTSDFTVTRSVVTGLEPVGLAVRPDGLELWTFQVNVGARRFYERHGFRAVELTDGSANEEHEPDVRYVWP